MQLKWPIFTFGPKPEITLDKSTAGIKFNYNQNINSKILPCNYKLISNSNVAHLSKFFLTKLDNLTAKRSKRLSQFTT